MTSLSDIKLFRIQNDNVAEVLGSSVSVEKSLQNLIETHLEAFLGIRLLASEHFTGKKHGGRIDTIGIDENGSPVIIEYKRALNESVINQGLYYLDWLLDHKADFTLLVMNKLGTDVSNEIEWDSPRLLCIAGDFTRYDEHATLQIDRNIELIRYRSYGDDLLLLEVVNSTQGTEKADHSGTLVKKVSCVNEKTISERLDQCSLETKDRFDRLRAFMMALGDDVQEKTLKNYFAFRRLKNFACVEAHPQLDVLRVYLKVNPDSIEIDQGFARDVRKIGHFGTGDLELTIRNEIDMERAKPLIALSYDAS